MWYNLEVLQVTLKQVQRVAKMSIVWDSTDMCLCRSVTGMVRTDQCSSFEYTYTVYT